MPRVGMCREGPGPPLGSTFAALPLSPTLIYLGAFDGVGPPNPWLPQPLISEFVRRSKRLNKDLDGFHYKELMLALAEESRKENATEDDDTEEDLDDGQTLMPKPLATVPATDEASVFFVPTAPEQVKPAPFLDVDNVQAMATGFLKMQPGAVSSAALFESSDDE